MPELPEVERAVALVRLIGKGNTITRVETSEDNIVFQGLPSHEDFAREISGRTLRDAFRYGKCFYIELEGEGRMPVLHFGMTGLLQVKNHPPLQYMNKVPSSDGWPPKFMKFIMYIEDKSSGEITEMAFSDARRLARIRLVSHPREEPPISKLGFDPILSMPSLINFRTLVLKRSCPIKALLLDQSFSAGVGNYLADEILYQAKVHPEQRCNTLLETQVEALHREVADVCRIAVEANADIAKYPNHWLFKHRWGKGKKAHSMTLPSGKPATIKWITVGGRTSAYVTEVQRLTSKQNAKTKVATDSEDESELTVLSSSDDDLPAASQRKRKRKSKTIKQSGGSEPPEVVLREKRSRPRKR